MKHFSYILVIIMSCSVKTEKQTVTISSQNKFTLPIIINSSSTDSIKPYTSKSVRGIFPQLIGKYKFGDTIVYTGQRQSENKPENEYLWEVQNATDSDTLSSDGLQIIPDYNTSLAYKWYDETDYLYYPVYIVNSTTDTKIFFGKDSHGFAIQEALDTTEYSQWHPIEGQGYDFCGNGRFRKKINPGEFLMFLLPKYNGAVNTSLRVRFEIGQNIFISKAFNGIIDPNQFKVEEDWMKQSLKETKGMASSWLFYGGRPKGSW